MTSELLNKRSAQGNELITGMTNMSRITLKIFELSVSHIDAGNPPKDNIVRVPKKTIYKFIGSSDRSTKWIELRKTLKGTLSEAQFDVGVEYDDGLIKSSVVNAFGGVEWDNRGEYVEFEFTRKIMPYLIELKKNFTQYLILDILHLNSRYSIILYKWLSMNYNQYDNYRMTKKRTKEQLDKLKNPYIGMNELRIMTNTLEGYERTFDFERYVLQVAVNEINEHTHFVVEYEKVKKGRKVVGFQFTIDKKAERAGLPYKEGDEAYMDDLKAKEENKGELFARAMKSPYTTILSTNLLLGLKEFQDDDVMASLQAFVYPEYDVLKGKRGIKGVEEHVAYVAQHKQGYSEHKQNIVKYLKRAIDQYLVTVELQDLD